VIDDISASIVTEELWRADPGVGAIFPHEDSDSNYSTITARRGMREEWLTRIADGESAIATAISEPAHGSDVSSIETRAERVINGEKT
jgi:alkylation response protein AidB-like acyl-CoA dehydrogenase